MCQTNPKSRIRDALNRRTALKAYNPLGQNSKIHCCMPCVQALRNPRPQRVPDAFNSKLSAQPQSSKGRYVSNQFEESNPRRSQLSDGSKCKLSRQISKSLACAMCRILRGNGDAQGSTISSKANLLDKNKAAKSMC